MDVNCKKLNCLILFLILFTNIISQSKSLGLFSPNAEIELVITVKDKIYYPISGDGTKLFTDNHLTLSLRNELLGETPELIQIKKKKVLEIIKPYIPLTYASVQSSYNSLLLHFKGDYSVEFRVFDDGVAYRFMTRKKRDIEVLNEDLTLSVPAYYILHLQQPDRFKTAYEESYSHLSFAHWKPSDKMSTLPALMDTKKDYKILVSEAGLVDYPAMFLKSGGDTGILAIFPKAPLNFGPDGDRSLKILKEADYIAKTVGTRTFPWRYFVITKDDKQLLENTMTLRLAPKSVIADSSWIKPGQAGWEWWNGATPYGPDMNFVSGYNLATYMYFIDFASKFSVHYIVMDEGWAKSTLDPYTPNPEIDVHEIIRYGKERNVGIILWLTWLTVHNHMELFKTFSQWEVKGVKIDFMDRSDQWMVDFYEEVAKEAAKYHIIVDFHGAFKPAGLEYKYPNLISYEGVKGMEQMSGCTPDNSLYFPFMRNAVGPMDYTPGAMISMQPDMYCSERPNSASIGTRAYQMALFVVFESGIQMLADNPTMYYRDIACTKFITSVPTTWDETKALAATTGEVAVVAKRKKEMWFIGGICNGKEKVRQVVLNFDFLHGG